MPNPQQAYEFVMHVLDQGIGIHTLRLKLAKRELFNPVIWMAHLIRLPITIMERAGLASHSKGQEVLVSTYGWFMRIAMGALVLIIIGHYGAKIPWSEILSRAIKTIFK